MKNLRFGLNWVELTMVLVVATVVICLFYYHPYAMTAGVCFIVAIAVLAILNKEALRKFVAKEIDIRELAESIRASIMFWDRRTQEEKDLDDIRALLEKDGNLKRK